MKRLVLCITLCASTGLFACEGASSSSSSSSNSNFEGPFADLSGIHKALKAFGPFLEKPHVQIDVNHTETTNQTIRHEKDSRLGQFGDALAHYAGQTLSTLLVQDLYHAIKNYLIPNSEAAFQENVANLKLLQAHNNEKEREENIQMMKEARTLITIIRELGIIATKRELTPEEQNLLKSAKNSLTIFQNAISAAA